jgi:integrase
MLTLRIAKASAAAGLPPECKAHGLRKALLRLLAEAGRSAKQIAAVSGHKSLKEIERYTADADQARLAEEAMDGV